MAKGLLESILVAEDFNVIFDTQGGVVLQMKDWAGYFYSEDAAAQCLLAVDPRPGDRCRHRQPRPVGDDRLGGAAAGRRGVGQHRWRPAAHGDHPLLARRDVFDHRPRRA